MSLTRLPLTSELVNSASALLGRALPGLSTDDRDQLDNIRVVHKFVGRDAEIAVEGERTTTLRLLCSGWAMQSVKLSGGRRQIIGFSLPGDLIGLMAGQRKQSICDVTSITPCEIAEFDLARVLGLTDRRQTLAAGIRHQITREAAILSDQVRRLGHMTAIERVCHFLLEIVDRQVALDESPQVVDFPITQSAVADALGLSVVHVNRQVMRLRREGLVSLDRRSLCIHDVDELRRLSGYKSRTQDRPPPASLRH